MLTFVVATATTLAVYSQTLWIFCWFFKRPPVSWEPAKVYVAVARWPCLLLWPFPLWGNLQMVVHSGPIGTVWGAIGALVNLYWAWIMWKTRHDDDDFWRKTKKKLKSVVKVVGGKLVVVPMPAPARI